MSFYIFLFLQDVLLCGVYARREAVFGNIDHARKIFDMALSSIDGLPQVHSIAVLLDIDMVSLHWKRSLFNLPCDSVSSLLANAQITISFTMK